MPCSLSHRTCGSPSPPQIDRSRCEAPRSIPATPQSCSSMSSSHLPSQHSSSHWAQSHREADATAQQCDAKSFQMGVLTPKPPSLDTSWKFGGFPVYPLSGNSCRTNTFVRSRWLQTTLPCTEEIWGHPLKPANSCSPLLLKTDSIPNWPNQIRTGRGWSQATSFRSRLQQPKITLGNNLPNSQF